MYRLHTLLIGMLITAATSVSAADPAVDIKKEGLFGFPQDKATAVCDTKDLRVAVWNDGANLFVQSIIWEDGDDSIGETQDGRKIGDYSNLLIDADSDGKVTPQIDRTYLLNPWPTRPGLHYQVPVSATGSTGMKGDSKGRGSIHYAPGAAGKVRVDSFVIPLSEIGRKPGDKIRLAYYASSPRPERTLNSIGFEKAGRYYAFHLPHAKYHEITLADRPAVIDLKKIPDGRDGLVPLEKKPVKPKPKVGSAPPEVTARDWLNTNKAPTLAALKGKVAVVEFWATWCGPCVAGIPHLNRLHEEHGANGLVILSFTDQSKTGIENFRKEKPMKYVLGTGSELASDYGVEGIPYAFIVGRHGKVVWHGNPNDKDFDKHLLAALAAK